MKAPKPTDKQTKSINRAFLKMADSIRRYMSTCKANASPLRSVTYRVLDNGETKLHVASRRVREA